MIALVPASRILLSLTDPRFHAPIFPFLKFHSKPLRLPAAFFRKTLPAGFRLSSQHPFCLFFLLVSSIPMAVLAADGQTDRLTNRIRRADVDPADKPPSAANMPTYKARRKFVIDRAIQDPQPSNRVGARASRAKSAPDRTTCSSQSPPTCRSHGIRKSLSPDRIRRAR